MEACCRRCKPMATLLAVSSIIVETAPATARMSVPNAAFPKAIRSQ